MSFLNHLIIVVYLFNVIYSYALHKQRISNNPIESSIMMAKKEYDNKADFNAMSLSEQNDPDNQLPDDAFGASVGPLPSVSSKINYGEEEIDETKLCDLWIVGCGTLGKLAAKQYKLVNPAASIIGETHTDKSHTELSAMQVFPRKREDRDDDTDYLVARNVLVCIPPSSSFNNEAYEQELYGAYRMWAGPDYGNFVFTSSTAVYGDSYGNTVNEEFRLDTRSLRAARMISAEEAILERDGSVIRLAGLYLDKRGPHTMWLNKGTVKGDPDGTINMLHYEDAASVCLKALESPLRNEIYLASDDYPVSRREICEAALVSGLFPDASMPVFEEEAGPVTKKTDCKVTREKLNWTPKYPSFQSFMYSLGGKEYVMKEKKVDDGSLFLGGLGDDDLDGLDMDFNIM